jgi:hypothetical protein
LAFVPLEFNLFDYLLTEDRFAFFSHRRSWTPLERATLLLLIFSILPTTEVDARFLFGYIYRPRVKPRLCVRWRLPGRSFVAGLERHGQNSAKTQFDP